MFDVIKAPNTANIYQKILSDIYFLIKFHNPQSILGITREELHELAQNIKNQYTTEIVEQAKVEIEKFHANKHLTIGIFLEKCAALDRSKKNIHETKFMISTNIPQNKDVAKENFKEIKTMLKSAIKELPYDKNIRVKEFHFTDAKSLKKHELPPYAACNFDMPIWEKTCYSDGPSLYAKCVAVDHILPYEAVQEPELRELYKKAWTMGLDKDEKARFNDLAIQYGYITPARKII